MTTPPNYKPRLAVVQEKRCGKCTRFRAANPDKGECYHFMYFPERYANQVCDYFKAT